MKGSDPQLDIVVQVLDSQVLLLLPDAVHDVEVADLVQIGTCNSRTHTLTPTHTHAPSPHSPAATPCSPFQKACAIALYKAPSQSDIVCFGEKENGRPRCSAAMASMVSIMTSMNLALSSAVNPALCAMARKSGWNVCHASEWPAMPRMCSFAVNTCRTARQTQMDNGFTEGVTLSALAT